MQTSSIDFVMPPASDSGHRSVFENLPAFEPQKGASLDGVLFSGKSSAQTHADLEVVALAPLVQLVRAATSWPEDRSEVESRVADFRYLVLDFRIGTDQVLYVQIRSTPTSHLIVEVGPGTPKDTELHALMTRQTAVLQGRGFQIGGNAGNFRKELPTPRDDADAARVAHELLALLTSVLLYDGTGDLTFELCQSTYLTPEHVCYGIAREGAAALLEVWGLRATQIGDQPLVFRSHSHGFDFTLHLMVPLKKAPERYWELHCHTSFPVQRGKLNEMLADINGKTWLLKAWARSDDLGPTPHIGIAYGFNLAGGVTLDHLKCQVFEWLGNVQKFYDKARAEELDFGEPSSDTPSSGMVH
jgi:hypothetical protein